MIEVKIGGRKIWPVFAFLLILAFSVSVDVFSVPGTGERRVVFVLIEFPDVKHSRTLGDLERTAAGLANYYSEQSYGKLTLRTQVVEKWYMASKPFSSYRIGDRTDTDGKLQLSLEAMRSADSEVDFSMYEFIVVMYAGPIKIGWAFGPIFQGEGVCFARFDRSCQNRIALDNESEFGTVFHEFGHLLDLPDLYDLKRSLQGEHDTGFVEDWDLMGGITQPPMELSAWCRMKLGWIAQDQIARISPGRRFNVTLAPLELGNGILAIKIPIATNTYYLTENRQPFGYDRILPGSGVLVYIANDALRSGEGPLRLVSLVAFDLKYDESSGRVNSGYVDDRNNVAILVLKKDGSSYLVCVSDAAGGRLMMQQINTQVKVQAVNASDTIRQAEQPSSVQKSREEQTV